MTAETGVELVWFAGAFALIVSALVTRRLPMADWIKMSLAWAAIIWLVFLIIRTWQLVT